ncbi:hypothetical protein L3Q82_001631 [Scortum barcoo]|uniref:Uncharacterized protein n=1 Tax=Scortum barcoo TaxID=214431 RepID=A0ACB8W5Z8_9TELE|nr:hypothetical protein L3Q82_001631 [Scortum barcoo]
MASPNSWWYLSTASGVPQANIGLLSPIGLLLQLDGIPYFRCPPPGSVVAATTDTRDRVISFELPRIDNGSREHGPLSERHLKRVLCAKGLSRRKAYSDLVDLVDFIRNQLQYSGQLHGYRWMYAKCREHGLRVRKEDVRFVLKKLDPRGVSLRQARRLRRRNYFSKGPNFIWHLDSYDKLKPYGICVNGSIDGFSRKIIWLNAYATNSDPKLIGGYYIKAVKRLGGCPRVVRGDLGTVNGHVRGFQCFLVPTSPDDTLDSYLEGASTTNQRIEYWWGFLRNQCVEFWLSLLSGLRDNGFFDGGFLDKSLLQFCCMGLIQMWTWVELRSLVWWILVLWCLLFRRAFFASISSLRVRSAFTNVIGCGLAIPYLGYLELEVQLCDKLMPRCGVLVVKDPPGGLPAQVPGVLGMNVIRNCYEELFGQHGVALFSQPCVSKAPKPVVQALQWCHRVRAQAPQDSPGRAKVRPGGFLVGL